MKPFWYDELITFYMARQPDLSSFIGALRDGADLNPPLVYGLIRLSHALFGVHELSSRIPAMLGFLVMLFALFEFLRPRVGAASALTAICLPLTTKAYEYAYEARTYGTLLGIAAFTLLAWQRVHDESSPRRGIWLAVLAMGLSLSLLTHTFGVFVFLPIIVGQAAWCVSHRRLDLRTWMCILAPSIVMVLFLPLVSAHNKFEMNNSIFRPHALSAVQAFRFLLEPAAAAFSCALAVMICIRALERGAASRLEDGERPSTFRLHELAALVTFTLVPVFAATAAYLVTNVFMDRYGLLAIIGITGLFALFHRQYAGPRTLAAAAVLLGSFLLSFVSWPAGHRPASHFNGVPSRLEEFSPSLPFVVGTGIWFLPLDYYSDEAFAKRLVYLRDRQAALKYTGSDVFEIGYPILKRWAPLRGSIQDYECFVRAHPRFLLYTSKGFALDWQMRKLIDDGIELQLLANRDEGTVFEARVPTAPGAPSAACPSTPP